MACGLCANAPAGHYCPGCGSIKVRAATQSLFNPHSSFAQADPGLFTRTEEEPRLAGAKPMSITPAKARQWYHDLDDLLAALPGDDVEELSRAATVVEEIRDDLDRMIRSSDV